LHTLFNQHLGEFNMKKNLMAAVGLAAVSLSAGNPEPHLGQELNVHAAAPVELNHAAQPQFQGHQLPFRIVNPAEQAAFNALITPEDEGLAAQPNPHAHQPRHTFLARILNAFRAIGQSVRHLH
jgi:hypothetical protein